MSWSAYLRWMLGTLLAAVAAVSAFNVLIDPLGVFGTPRVQGVNALKPYLDHHRELARWSAARRQCAAVGVFGNSRAEIGFDPAGPALRGQGLEAFNHAIPGSGVVLAYRQLEWLRSAGCAPRMVILGVEFFDFLGADSAARLPLEPTPAPGIDLPFLAETVFSLTGLGDAAGTLLLQRAAHPATITERGFNPLYGYIAEVENSGHYLLFRQRAEENLKTWMRKAPRITPPEGGQSADYAGLKAFLTAAAPSAEAVHLVIYPYHAEIRLMMERLGLTPLFAEWKRSLVALAERQAAQGQAVDVWDFSGLHPYTLEAIPPRGDRHTQLQYYWEAGHFKSALGERVLARILGEDSDFGARLESHNLDPWLAEDQRRVLAQLAEPSPLRIEVDDLMGLRERYTRPAPAF